jgi:hypothetical protein
MASRHRHPNKRWPVWTYLFMLIAGVAALLSLILLLVGGVRDQ